MYEKLRLDPGLLVLRHVAPGEGPADALLRPIVPLASRGAISVVFDPATPDGVLRTPGQLCVIRVAQSAVMLLEITSASGQGEPRGGIELRYLSRSTGIEGDPPGLGDMTVHVEGLGDRSLRHGDWGGDEAGVKPLVGLQMVQRLQGPRIILRDPVSGQIAAPGEFLGARAGMRPLTGLDLWLEAPDGSHVLKAEADFQVAGRVSARGTAVSLRGAGPGDQMIRLRLVPEPLELVAEPKPLPRSARLRIFRKDDVVLS